MAVESEQMGQWLEAGGGKNEMGAQPAAGLTAALAKSADGRALLADAAAHAVSRGQLSKRLSDIAKTSAAVRPEIAKLAASNSDSVLLQMLKVYAPPWLVGILAAGIISAVMGSDCHQILGLSTMFTKDLFQYYGHAGRFGEKTTVMMGRTFIIVLNGLAYCIALSKPPIFDLAVTYAFAGFAAMSPVMIAALFWRRSTKYGALASTLWVAGCVGAQLVLENVHPVANRVLWEAGGHKILFLNAMGKLSFMNFTMVVPIVIGSAILMGVVSAITPGPSRETIEKYFPRRQRMEAALAGGA
jgi:SSS family solute:Na+ symporter